MKEKLTTALDKLASDRDKWQARLYHMSGKVTDAKTRGRLIAQQHIDTALAQEAELQKHIDALREDNVDLKEKLKDAKIDIRSVTKSCERVVKVAQKRLDKWRAERAEKEALKDELTCIMKIKASQAEILTRYKSEVVELRGKW